MNDTQRHTTHAPDNPVHILVAEDSESNQMLLSLYLNDSGYALDFAMNGRDAVERFKSGSYGLVLMDIFMPVLDGLDATREIRAFEKERGLAPVPIVAVSANAFDEDRKRSMKAGCSDFLAKPIRKIPLLKFLADTLGKKPLP
ncbi:response regulator receiver protein [Pseudodesulfovibrio mercurii]|uniref:Response regulator receiver protein n=1 Tax=Pseudodesulfovibrio mercurii TaxID=641491 RepID=F0JBF4_9BACT|nr:response regulator [Pseudodesulfovibrio mercurii]EGB14273.1 response regulator receiver protein [Pseudodesulfovibrio mercurii]